MKILGAAVAIPTIGNVSYSYSSAYAVGAARLALEQAGCLPSELDLIVSLSISPNRIVDDPAIAGPRLAHPVQRDLGARHATVFDLLDADWTIALDFAQSHCRWLGYQRALVVRAEALADVECVDASGFADGAGAIVLTSGGQDRRHISGYADIGGETFVSLDAIAARCRDANGPVARFESRFDVATGRFDAERDALSTAVRTVMDEMRSRVPSPVDVLFHESWLGAPTSVDDGVEVVGGAPAIPSPFQLPAWLAGCVAESRRACSANCSVAALTLDVFRQRVACSTMEV